MVKNPLIVVSVVTKCRLDDLRVHPRETYDDILVRLLNSYSGDVK